MSEFDALLQVATVCVTTCNSWCSLRKKLFTKLRAIIRTAGSQSDTSTAAAAAQLYQMHSETLDLSTPVTGEGEQLCSLMGASVHHLLSLLSKLPSPPEAGASATSSTSSSSVKDPVWNSVVPVIHSILQLQHAIESEFQFWFCIADTVQIFTKQSELQLYANTAKALKSETEEQLNQCTRQLAVWKQLSGMMRSSTSPSTSTSASTSAFNSPALKHA